jgi:hypothetical protein
MNTELAVLESIVILCRAPAVRDESAQPREVGGLWCLSDLLGEDSCPATLRCGSDRVDVDYLLSDIHYQVSK